ncbi:bifunctional diguanylate cyclase/phosphodiesterase [Chitinimonas sp. BJB300]|uniref:bifunctional diguanylate cyclase/phosphodiesterase n=1 Tax=Chitinimonas sp. BJB300 TaxID=1559339 RepID=UPI000C0D73D3|nr:EAL domain-containing protein [Chitinimonas sp. BJB300]PHV10208.1 GGDEF domain-containing protein [Chitinimonas sp. BJB300]TSJ91098.1 EAL domain-containing protein [Chitinimonas sp. BJB300]
MQIINWWRRGRHRLAFRIVLHFTGLLAVMLGVAFVMVSVVNMSIFRGTAALSLESDEKVFRRLLEYNTSNLIQGASVLAGDYGLREAIGTGDMGTLLSALNNHSRRIGATMAMVSGLDNHLLADTLHPDQSDQAYPFKALLAEAEKRGNASSIELIDGVLYRIVVVPVRAPTTIAWITIGFPMDERRASELHNLAGVHVSFLSHNQSNWQLLTSTFSPEQRQSLLATLKQFPTAGMLKLNGETFETRLALLADTPHGQVYALLAGSLDVALQPAYKLRGISIVLTAFALLVGSLIGARLARRITDPLRALAVVAQHIQAGDYQQEISITDTSEIGQLAGSLTHMQEAIALRETEISKLAFQDSLTGLPNRVRFNQCLDEAITMAQANQSYFTVLLVGLDRFQQINDTLGHQNGDRVLIEVSQRLSAAINVGDVVARLAGDEFALLLSGLQMNTALQSIDRIHTVFVQRFNLDGRLLDVRASIGLVGFPEHGDTAADLMRCVDVALYRAKRSGSHHALYDPGTKTFREEHLSLLGDLQQAVEHNELIVYYQPKVGLGPYSADEAEALVRWKHPTKGFVSPGEFIPYAEQTGYIKELTHWVLVQVIRQAGQWLREGRPVKVSVNLSTRDLVDQGLPATIATLIDRAGLPPEYLCLEITESGFMEEPAEALNVLQKLRSLGLSLAIDDYGTGYSSLAYIRRLPITELKIDRAFIIELASNVGDAKIVRSTIDLGHHLGLKVVAEGVEDMVVVDILAEMGCDSIQGFVFGKPMPVAEFDRWREARMARPTLASANLARFSGPSAVQ